MRLLEPYRRAQLGCGCAPQGCEIFPGLPSARICAWAVARRIAPRRTSSQLCWRSSPPVGVARSHAAFAAARVWFCWTSRRRAFSLPLSRRSSRPCSAAGQERAHDDLGQAESRLHRRALATHPYHPEGVISREAAPAELLDVSRIGEFVGSQFRARCSGHVEGDPSHGSQETHTRSAT